MDLSNHLWNSFFIVLTGIAFATAVVVLLRSAGAKDKIGMTLSGAFVFVLFFGIALLWGDGEIRTAFTDEVKSAFFTSSIPIASATQPIVSEINIQVDVPEQPPVTVIVQNETSPDSAEEAPSELVEPEIEAAESVSRSDRTEMFDLGSEVDGYFKDGVPYKLYEIQPGDTVYSIRTHFGLSEAELTLRNGIDIRRPLIIAGRKLKIPME